MKIFASRYNDLMSDLPNAKPFVGTLRSNSIHHFGVVLELLYVEIDRVEHNRFTAGHVLSTCAAPAYRQSNSIKAHF